VIIISPMSTHWDTIVIGAGIGGLSAAAKLVKAGLRVLVLEKSHHPGGTAYVYTRKGFTFPMGPLGFSTPRLVRDALLALDQGPDLEFHPVSYRIRAFGLDIPISLPFNRIQSEVGHRFPAERQSIRQFFDDMGKILAALRSPNSEVSRSTLAKAEATPAYEYLNGRIHDWRLQRILGSLGTREPYTGLSLLAAMWGLMSREGIWYPKGGMRAFCDRLVDAISNASMGSQGVGKIRLGTEVKRIRIRGGRALGVTLADGTQIDGAAVISNGDYKTTFIRLIDPRIMSEKWRGLLKRAKQTNSVLQVCLGIDTSRVDLSAFSEASRLIFRQSLGEAAGEERVDWLAEKVNPETLAAQELEVSLWSREDSTLAPPGGAVIVMRTEADYAHFSKYRPRYGRRSLGYRSYKTELSRALVRQGARLIPGLKEAIQILDVATPLTFEERGGRTEGAVAGWSWDFKDNPNQPVELVRTPIKGLYMAGYQAFSALFMGGVPTAMLSGHRAAESVLEGSAPVEAFRLPGL
jgi:phytoene dehydrogenase-like protein